MSERDDLPQDIEALKALVFTQRAELASRLAEIDRLHLIIAKLRRLQFGPRSERIDREIEQLQLQLEELQSASTPVEVAAPAAEEKTQLMRRALPEHLPRERVVHEPAPADAELDP